MSSSAVETAAVEREITIAAKPETVWGLLVDPAKATRWMGLEAWLDPRPGGLYRVRVTPTRTARGEFVEVDPPRRLVYTFGWEEPDALVSPGGSTVVLELVPEGDGTRVRLTHRDLPSGASDGHARGWEHYLTRLATVAAGGDPGPDPWASEQAREERSA